MEPLHPRDREALKRTHPGLTDADIDRTEELVTQVDTLDELGKTDEAEELRVQLSDLVRQRIPRYQEVMRELAASRKDEVRRRGVQPRVFQKKPPR